MQAMIKLLLIAEQGPRDTVSIYSNEKINFVMCIMRRTLLTGNEKAKRNSICTQNGASELILYKIFLPDSVHFVQKKEVS